MAEPVFLRVRRVMSASVEEAVDAMERAGGASLMREAIRQVARALDEVRVEQEAALARGANAKRQQQSLRERATDMEEKARFALGKERDDLAEAAVSRQLDFEAQAERLDTVQSDAAEEAARLAECAVALAERKKQMEDELALYQESKRDAVGQAPPEDRIKKKVERAEEAFSRVMGHCEPTTRADADAAAKLSEIDSIKRSSAVAERLAALRSAPPAGQRRQKRAASARPAS
jgi:phage shock protein A